METRNDFICPICRSKMVLRTGKTTGKKFWGCVNYFSHDRCPGKRGLDGQVFGTDGEYPFSLGPDGETMFDIGRSEGMSFEEAQEFAEAWEHDEDNDPYK